MRQIPTWVCCVPVRPEWGRYWHGCVVFQWDQFEAVIDMGVLCSSETSMWQIFTRVCCVPVRPVCGRYLHGCVVFQGDQYVADIYTGLLCSRETSMWQILTLMCCVPGRPVCGRYWHGSVVFQGDQYVADIYMGLLCSRETSMWQILTLVCCVPRRPVCGSYWHGCVVFQWDQHEADIDMGVLCSREMSTWQFGEQMCGSDSDWFNWCNYRHKKSMPSKMKFYCCPGRGDISCHQLNPLCHTALSCWLFCTVFVCPCLLCASLATETNLVYYGSLICWISLWLSPFPSTFIWICWTESTQKKTQHPDFKIIEIQTNYQKQVRTDSLHQQVLYSFLFLFHFATYSFEVLLSEFFAKFYFLPLLFLFLLDCFGIWLTFDFLKLWTELC